MIHKSFQIGNQAFGFTFYRCDYRGDFNVGINGAVTGEHAPRAEFEFRLFGFTLSLETNNVHHEECSTYGCPKDKIIN